ncbi:hypothetical protein [Thiobacillus sp.]
MFDPWTAGLEEAQEEEKRVSAERAAGPCSPVMQWGSASQINEWKQAVEAGDGYAVMACVSLCVTHGLIAPDWLAYAFNQKYYAVAACRAESWDDPKSFGRPFPKGKHLSRMRQDKFGRFAVWNAVCDTIKRDPDRAIDRGLFEEVGKSLGFGATRAERLYYEAVNNGLGNIAKSIKLAGIQKKSR